MVVHAVESIETFASFCIVILLILLLSVWLTEAKQRLAKYEQ